MKDDTISRAAAIDKFEPWLKADGYSEGELNMLKAVLYELRVMPSAQQWIPVTERLPERNGYYLVTGRQGAVNKRLYQDGYWYGNWTVFAWLPLPEPAKIEG